MNIERVWGCVFAASLAFAIVIVFIIALGVALRVTFGGAA